MAKEYDGLPYEINGPPIDENGHVDYSVQYSGAAENEDPYIEDGRPRLTINDTDERDLLRSATKFLAKYNAKQVRRAATPGEDPPLIFRQDSVLAKIFIPLKPLSGAPPPARIEPLSNSETRRAINDAIAIRKIKHTKTGPDYVPASMPENLVAAIRQTNSKDFPPLESVIATPIFGVDGKLIDRQGYDAANRVWLQLDPDLIGLKLPTVDKAYETIMDKLLGEFPFERPSDKAHAVASILLPFVRRMIRGNTPLHVVTSPLPGSGKSTLCRISGALITGGEVPSSALSLDEVEVQKSLLAEASTGAPVIIFDNAPEGEQLDSPRLASVTSSTTFSGRILGTSRIGVVSNLSTWFLNGNNITLSSELFRRSIRIRLCPKDENVNDIKYPKEYPSWVYQNRAEIISAIIALVQYWDARGKPRPEKTLLGFDEWSHVIGGVLAAAGIRGFLEDRELASEELDETRADWLTAVGVWWERYRDATVLVKELNELFNEHGVLTTLRGTCGAHDQQIRLGKGLKIMTGRIFGGRKVERCSRNKHGVPYRLSEVNQDLPGQAERGAV